MEKTVAVPLAESTARILQRAAEMTYRSLDDLIKSVVNVALSMPSEAPTELANELAAMSVLSDAALWAASESALSPAQQRRLSQLSHAAGERRSTVAESTELEQLLELYDHSAVRRARALALLALRGYELPDRDDWPDTNEDEDDHL